MLLEKPISDLSVRRLPLLTDAGRLPSLVDCVFSISSIPGLLQPVVAPLNWFSVFAHLPSHLLSASASGHDSRHTSPVANPVQPQLWQWPPPSDDKIKLSEAMNQ